MAVKTSDLVSSTSGTASIGVEQVGVGNFTLISPFNHIHQHSGVYHAYYGESGVIRFGLDVETSRFVFESSHDGGLTFDSLPQSGQILESIRAFGGGGGSASDLQDAYDGGNEIDHNADTFGYRGVLVRETIPGVQGPSFSNGIAANEKVGKYGIAVSGHSLTPLDINRFGFAQLNSESLFIKSSGFPGTLSRDMFLGFEPASPETALLTTSGTLNITTLDPLDPTEVDGSMTLTSANALFLIGTNSAVLSCLNGVTVQANGDSGDVAQTAGRNITADSDEGNIELTSGDGGGTGLGGQIELNAFASSGRFQFRFGPYQAWHAKLTHSSSDGPDGDGFWPLPHSGQILEMIQLTAPGGGGHTMQAAYDGGNVVFHRADELGYKGVVIKEGIPGRGGGYANNADITANVAEKYGVAVSGYTLTPLDKNSFAFSSLDSSALVISSSGTPLGSDSRNFFLGFAENIPGTVFFASNGDLFFNVAEDITLSTDDGDILLTSANNDGTGLGGQLTLDAFDGSGSLQYRMGPFEAWAQSPSYDSTGGPASDGYHPIPHSGQILQMILENGGGGGAQSKAITIETPKVNDDLTIWYTNSAITVSEVESVVRGDFDASGQFAIRYAADRSQFGTELTSEAITCTSRTTGEITTSFAAASIPADNWIWIGVSGVSGVATDQLNVTIQYAQLYCKT